MKFARVFSTVLLRLSDFPGLKFLQAYVISAQSMTTRFGQRKGDYEAYVMSGQNAMREVGWSPGGGGEGGAPSAESGEQPSGADDYDFYDDYEDEARADARIPGDPSAAEDNYPASDDYRTYYDDDYYAR